MKKVLFIFTVYSLSLSLVLAQESKYRIDGKSYNKQIYDDNNNQITEFENWEYIKDFYISPNNKKMLVYHKPDKAKAYLMSLYDLESRSLTAECEPGWACDDIKWTKDFLIKVWGTSGGGTRFEYRSYEDLSIIRVVTSYIPFEDVEDDILIDPDSMMRKIVFHRYTDGTLIKEFDCIKALAEKGIYTNCIQIQDTIKIGKRKYEFHIEGTLNIEGREDEEFQTVLEIEI